MSKFKTLPTHWDCDCEVFYIHNKAESTRCEKCGACEEDSPDSRQDEVKEGAALALRKEVAVYKDIAETIVAVAASVGSVTACYFLMVKGLPSWLIF